MTDEQDLLSLLQRINKFIDEAKEGVIWRTSSGKKIRSVKDVDDFYLINILRYMERMEKRYGFYYHNRHLFEAEAVLRGLYVQDTNTPTIRQLY